MTISIAEAFKRFRRDFKLSQRDVAERLKVSQPAYAVYESKGTSPTGATLIKMAKEFNVSTDYLLGLTEEPRPVNEILNAGNDTLKAEVERIKADLSKVMAILNRDS